MAVGTPLEKLFQEKKIGYDDQLVLLLLYHMHVANSFWKPWLNVIPKEYTNTIFWNESEMQILRGSNLLILTHRLLDQIAKDFADLTIQLADKIEELYGNLWNLEMYKWGLATLWSRAFDATIIQQPSGGSNRQANRRMRVFAPFADMFNHSNLTKEEHGYNPQACALQSKTYSEFKRGDSVVINYGAFPNHKLLRLYGFAVADNPFDHVELFCPMSHLAPYYEEKVKILEKYSIFNDTAFPLQLTQRLPENLIATLRIQRMEKEELGQEKKAFSKNGIISFKNEFQILTALKEALTEMLAQYPGTLEEIQTALQHSKNPKMTFAYLLIIPERQILQHNINLVTEKLKKLEKSQNL